MCSSLCLFLNLKLTTRPQYVIQSGPSVLDKVQCHTGYPLIKHDLIKLTYRKTGAVLSPCCLCKCKKKN